MDFIAPLILIGDCRPQGTKNQEVDRLSHLQNKKFQREKKDIEDGFPNEQLFCIEVKEP